MSKRSSRIFNRMGFTLIEVLVSTAILLLAVLAIFSIIVYGSFINKEQLVWRRTYNELERILENPQYSYINYLDLTPDSTYNLDDVTLDDRGTADTGDDLMGTNVRVTVVNETFSQGAIANIPAKRVTAFISWNDEGKNVTDSLATIITLETIH